MGGEVRVCPMAGAARALRQGSSRPTTSGALPRRPALTAVAVAQIHGGWASRQCGPRTRLLGLESSERGSDGGTSMGSTGLSMESIFEDGHLIASENID